MFPENLFIPSGVAVTNGRARAIVLSAMGNSVHPDGAAHRVCGWSAEVLETETRQALNKFHRRGNMVLVGRLAFR